MCWSDSYWLDLASLAEVHPASSVEIERTNKRSLSVLPVSIGVVSALVRRLIWRIEQPAESQQNISLLARR